METEVPRKAKEEYVKKYVAVYAELLPDDQLDELYTAVQKVYREEHNP